MKFETTDYIETAVEIEKIRIATKRKHCNEIIPRFLICANYYHNLIGVKPKSKIKQFINVVNIILLGDLSAKQKVKKFQDQRRVNYKEFVKLHFYLKSLADQVKKEIQEEKNGNK